MNLTNVVVDVNPNDKMIDKFADQLVARAKTHAPNSIAFEESGLQVDDFKEYLKNLLYQKVQLVKSVRDENLGKKFGFTRAQDNALNVPVGFAPLIGGLNDTTILEYRILVSTTYKPTKLKSFSDMKKISDQIDNISDYLVARKGQFDTREEAAPWMFAMVDKERVIGPDDQFQTYKKFASTKELSAVDATFLAYLNLLPAVGSYILYPQTKTTEVLSLSDYLVTDYSQNDPQDE